MSFEFEQGLSYAQQHNKFVTSVNGTTPGEIMSVFFSIASTSLLANLVLPWILSSSLCRATVQSERLLLLLRSIVEYPFVLLLVLSILTIFNGGVEDDKYAPTLLIFLLSLCFGLLFVNHSITRPIWRGCLPNIVKELGEKKIGWTSLRVPFVTNYRGAVILSTLISILAVDFVIFPRRFAKTKVYGFSLMDLGTGSIIFANGIVSPEAKSRIPQLKKALISSIPLLILGFVRLITVKGIQYPEVEEEYGRHWNFFFTLCAIKICNALTFSLIQSPLISCILLSFATEFFFIQTRVQEDYILNPEVSRDSDLIAANREGIFSISGYFSIYLASVYIGRLIHYKERESIKEWGILLARFLVQNCLLWIGFWILNSFGGLPCRRSANLNYVLWTICANYSILSFYLLLSLIQSVCQQLGFLHGPLVLYELTNQRSGRIQDLKSRTEKIGGVTDLGEVDEKRIRELEKNLQRIEKESGKDTRREDAELDKMFHSVEEELMALEFKLKQNQKFKLPDLASKPSIVCESICFNGLTLFVLGNLLTGLVNSCVHSMLVPYGLGFFIVLAYITVVYIIGLILYLNSISLKFW